MNQNIVLIAHNLRSCHNVGSLLRTAEGIGIGKVWLTGYTPYPSRNDDERPPHIAAKINKQIEKTALGAEKLVDWDCAEDVFDVMRGLTNAGYTVCALEQTSSSIPLPSFKPPSKIALIVGNEVKGIDKTLLDKVDICLEIAMLGKKESFNVVQAAAMALYHLRFSRQLTKA